MEHITEYKSGYLNVIERDVEINNTKVHVKSIFSETISLDKAMKNIVCKKLSIAKSN